MRQRGGSETLIDAKPFLTTGWFDTADEYEKHKRGVKNRLSKSSKWVADDSDFNKVYQSYKDMGGLKGSLIMGGPDAFDIASNGGLGELMGSIGSKSLASFRYRRKICFLLSFLTIL